MYTHRNLRALALGLGAVAAVQSTALAQFDAQVTNIKWTQAIQTTAAQDLAYGKPTVVRALCSVVNPPTDPVPLDGIMRVYVDGLEAPFSPVFSDNGPYLAGTVPGTFNVESDTLNFIFLPPESDDVVVEVEINPPGPNFVPEADTTNNTRSSGPREFVERATPELVYSPINYTPGGGTPNPLLIEPGAGDDMVQGMFAPADWYYHRTDAPSKLWTTSLNSSSNGLNNSLLADLNMMVPKPDFIYGWVIGGLPYNGVAIGIPGQAANGNTQNFKHQRTFAHELGHLLGFPHNSTQLAFPGADVEESLLLNHGLGMVKPIGLNDIMVPGLNTNQAWIARSTFSSSFNNGAFQPGPKLSGPGLLVTGLWNKETGALVLDNVVNLPAVRPTAPVTEAEASFIIEAYADGSLLERLPLAVNSATDCAVPVEDGQDGHGDSNRELTEVSVFFSMLSGAQEIDRLTIVPVPGVKASSLTLNRSAGRPEAQFAPVGGPLWDVSAGQVKVAWSASDPDGDPLTYYLRYSRDGFHYSPLASGITVTEWDVDVGQLPAFEDGEGFFELLVSDGLNTVVARSPSLVGSGTLWAQGSNPPWVEILTPDNTMSYLEGSTVILHSSGWDLEDRALLDPSIAWTSNVDGFLGNGRLISVATLTPGSHDITVTATDSDSLTSSDTHGITITARGLPDLGAPTNYCTPGTSASGCQAKLTFTGVPSATAPSGFQVTAGEVEGNKDGLFFYGTNGRQANSWGNGSSFQCVVPPTTRTSLTTAAGTVGACDGTAQIDLNATWTAVPAKNPGAGAVVDLQFWYRDPLNTSNQTTSLSNGLEFTGDP